MAGATPITSDRAMARSRFRRDDGFHVLGGMLFGAVAGNRGAVRPVVHADAASIGARRLARVRVGLLVIVAEGFEA
jgi:hypothetical protein